MAILKQRVSANIPRCVSVHPLEENLDLDDGQWEEIHVITGALKLFFRELPEPLFPFSHFNKFIAAISKVFSLLPLTCLWGSLSTSYLQFTSLVWVLKVGFFPATDNTDYSLKMNTICELVRSLPQPNYDTMKVLFGHLHKWVLCFSGFFMTFMGCDDIYIMLNMQLLVELWETYQSICQCLSKNSSMWFTQRKCIILF